MRRLVSTPHGIALVAVVMLGALLRFSTLGLQSYRYDEAVTVARVLHPSLFDTLAAVPRSESTPPLYYAVAWLWTRPFGSGEVWLRSLSALAGTASIAVVYLAARALLLSRRAGLVAAAIVAVSPVLIWFSQDARAYALVFLFAALSFLCFARAHRSGARRDLVLWATFSALAIATHYFAGFLVLPEAALLIAARRPRRPALLASLAIAVVAALLAPIGIPQAENAHAGWIASQPIGERLERTGAKLAGSENGDEHGARQEDPIPWVLPAALALAALALLAFADPGERRAVGLPALVGGAGLGLPLLLALLGADYVDGRNLLPVFVPLIVLIGAGFAVRRAARLGTALALAFCLCSLLFAIEIDRLPRLQREDLRNAAAQVGGLGPGKAVVTNRYAAGWPLRYYLGARFAKGPLPPLREIDLVGSRIAADRSAARLLPAAFRRVSQRPVSYEFTLSRYRAPRPLRVPWRVLSDGALVGGGRSTVLVSPAPSAWPSASPAGSPPAPGGPAAP
jgi:mannosyltransferase